MHFVYVFCLTLLFCLPGSVANAQDIHYSQFSNSPLNLNPAMTGTFRGDQRFAGIFRNQWSAVPVDYLQFSGAYDQRLHRRGQAYAPTNWALGGLLNYDRAGDGKLRMIQLAPSVSYTVPLARRHGLALGANVSIAQRAFSADALQFSSQYSNKRFDASRPSNERFDEMSIWYPNAALGADWHYEAVQKRTTVDVGAGFNNLLTPEVAFYGAESHELPVRTSYHAAGTLQLADRFDLVLNGLHQRQGEYDETVLGLGGWVHLNTRRTQELALLLGVATRLDDAVIPYLGLRLQNWRASFSYDINTSAFNQVTNNRGGPEISLQHRITRVKPLDYCPRCPTYL